jgi:hypothetical protein
MTRFHSLALVLALAGGQAIAAEPATALPAWEQLSPAQREVLIAPLRERWNENPSARARLFDHARRWRQLTPKQREGARRGLRKWDHMDPRERDTMRALFHQMRGMDPEQRRQLRDQWRSMSAQQREDWVRTHPPSGD